MPALVTASRVYPTCGGLILRNSGKPEFPAASTSFMAGRTLDVDGRDKCMARRHPRQVFGDMTDTSLWHGIGLGGLPCLGERCRLWLNGESSFDWRCRRERTGGNCAGGWDPSGHWVQVARQIGWRWGASRSLASSPFEPSTDGCFDRGAH